jgi:FAD/FMN-containing dehydrogenase
VTLTTDTRTETPTVPQQRPSLDALRTRLTGALHEPHETGYEELVTPWNLAVPMRPAAVVAAATAEDVAATVRFARSAGLSVGVQATGHGAITAIAGHLMVATRGLDEVTVHPEGWARVGAGVKWARVIEAAAPHGLAPLNGSSSDVGVVGYTTGGGVGPMARTFGLAADRVRAFDVVTGDGELRRVTPTEHPDLFFALRGGKGAAGIVTAVEFDLVPLPFFYGGAIYFDGADAPAVIAAWRSGPRRSRSRARRRSCSSSCRPWTASRRSSPTA